MHIKLTEKDKTVTQTEIMRHIQRKIENALPGTRTKVMHLQMIKFHKELEDLTGAEFCRGVGIGKSFGTEFLKMRSVGPELVNAGLDTSLID